jgi:hypothetical protein
VAIDQYKKPAIPISKRKSQEMRFLREPVPKPIYNFTPIRNFGAFLALPRQKPGFSLQSFG